MLELSYVILSVIMTLILIGGYYLVLQKQGVQEGRRNRNTMLFAGALIGVFAYVTLLSKSGILENLSLPPRFALFFIIPFFLFLIAFYVRNKNNATIHAIPIRWPIYYQTFRIVVELLLLYTFYKGIIPQQATFEGLNYDILMGISAPAIAYFVYRKGGVKNKLLARIWNILGMLLIFFVAFIIMTSLYQPQIWGGTEPLVKMEFMRLPYILIPTFLAPSAIFIHVVALIQLRKRNYSPSADQ